MKHLRSQHLQTPEACPTAADQEKNVPTPSYYTAKEIRTSDRVVSFPRPELKRTRSGKVEGEREKIIF